MIKRWQDWFRDTKTFEVNETTSVILTYIHALDTWNIAIEITVQPDIMPFLRIKPEIQFTTSELNAFDIGEINWENMQEFAREIAEAWLEALTKITSDAYKDIKIESEA